MAITSFGVLSHFSYAWCSYCCFFFPLLQAVYYVFAVLGMMLFANVSDPSDVGKQETR